MTFSKWLALEDSRAFIGNFNNHEELDAIECTESFVQDVSGKIQFRRNLAATFYSMRGGGQVPLSVRAFLEGQCKTNADDAPRKLMDELGRVTVQVDGRNNAAAVKLGRPMSDEEMQSDQGLHASQVEEFRHLIEYDFNCLMMANEGRAALIEHGTELIRLTQVAAHKMLDLIENEAAGLGALEF